MKKNIIICGTGRVTRSSLIHAKEILSNKYHLYYGFIEKENIEIDGQKNSDLSKDLNITPFKIGLYKDLFKKITNTNPDYIFFIKFSLIIKQDLIKLFKGKMFNLHYAPLPKYRGIASITHALLRGEETFGITLHLIDGQIDTGDIIDQSHFDIKGKTNEEVYELCNKSGEIMMRDIFQSLNKCGKPGSFPQDDSHATYFSKKDIDYSNTKIDFSQTSSQILQKCLAWYFPSRKLFPRVETGDGLYEVREIPQIGERNIGVKQGTVVKKNPLVVATFDRFVIFNSLIKVE